jgi:hypothetical protein
MGTSLLPYAVLAFGIASLWISYSVLKHHNEYWMAEAIVMMSIPIAITLIVFLLAARVAPDNDKELIAILSGIVGFVFGFVSNKK